MWWPLFFWLPNIIFVSVWIITAFWYFSKDRAQSYAGTWGVSQDQTMWYWRLALGVLVFRFLYAITETYLQYLGWSEGEFTRLLLTSPLSDKVVEFLGVFAWIFNNPLGYFSFYVFQRFFLNSILVLIVGTAFYYFLKLLLRHSDRFFDEGEVELGFLMAALVGWPGFAIFIILTFFMVLVVSFVRRIFLGELYTTLGIPMLLSGIVVLVLGEWLITLLNLGVLRA